MSEIQFTYTPDHDPIDSEVLAGVPNPRPNREFVDSFEHREFTTNCPVNYGVDPEDEDDEPESQGVRDFGVIRIECRPKDYIIELKTLKYYLSSFDEARVAHEEVANIIWEDLADVLFPDASQEERLARLQVEFDVEPRGGIYTDVTVGSLRYE